jgi:acylglycerol lipase
VVLIICAPTQGPGQPNKYEGSWIETWNKAGYSVCGIDLHGHGRSSGLRGYTESFSHFVDDILDFNRVVKATDVPGFASLPIFAVAGSLGGCIATAAAQKEKDSFAGEASCVSTMIGIRCIS